MLLRYIYISSARRPMLPEDLRDIATTATHHNQRSAMTGLLLYGSMSFIQLIEGPIKLLPLTYARIAEDPRHRNIELLVRDRVSERLFPQWHMGVISLEDISRIDRNHLNAFVERVKDQTLDEATRGERAMDLIRLFRVQAGAEPETQTRWKLKPGA